MSLVLDTQTTGETDAGRPLSVNLALEVEGLLLVGDVARCDEETKGDPGEERVDGQERAVVEQDSRPTNERGKEAKG